MAWHHFDTTNGATTQLCTRIPIQKNLDLPVPYMKKVEGEKSNVAEPKLFIFGFVSTFAPYFNYSSSYGIANKKLFYNSNTVPIEVEISFSSY